MIIGETQADFIKLGRKTRNFSRGIQGPTRKPKGFLFL